ncbi:hypothetical protein [Arthrobacter sp. H5]|uniref:hypothetical protein n=1 Tax=Arthrobacter sp. H5 TaxID=1267973 RepID=UPI0004864564|nr:hypothetical protein [Arthrobacter sp. H5]
MAPQILCISFSDISADSRVLRQIAVLAEFGEVTTVSYGVKPPGATHHLEIDSSLPSLPQTPKGVVLLAARQYEKAELAAPAIQAALRLCAGIGFDLVVANEARALPLAHKIAGGNPVWGDMHEWAPEERAHVRSWKLLVKPFMTHVCASYLPRTHAVSVVNDSIAALYREEFGCSTVTVRNARPFEDLQPSEAVPDVIRLAHSGAAVPGRNIEGMIDAVGALGPGYTLDLYLVKARDGGKYWRTLERMAAGMDQVRFHPAVRPDELPRVLNAYDVGIFSLPPQTRNHALMLPNKFFDFVQARLAIVFSPSPETTQLIRSNDLGAVTVDFSSRALTDTIRGLTAADIASYKSNSHRAAMALSSSTDEEVERDILRAFLPVKGGRD